jgi:hypothetical protein
MCFSATEVTRNIRDVGLVLIVAVRHPLCPGVDSWLGWCRKASFIVPDIAVAYFRLALIDAPRQRSRLPKHPTHALASDSSATPTTTPTARSCYDSISSTCQLGPLPTSRDPIDASWLKIPAAVRERAILRQIRFLFSPRHLRKMSPRTSRCLDVQNRKQKCGIIGVGNTAPGVPPYGSATALLLYCYLYTLLCPSSHSSYLPGTLSDSDSVADALAQSHLYHFSLLSSLRF